MIKHNFTGYGQPVSVTFTVVDGDDEWEETYEGVASKDYGDGTFAVEKDFPDWPIPGVGVLCDYTYTSGHGWMRKGANETATWPIYIPINQ